jgi:hypothetical protein
VLSPPAKDLRLALREEALWEDLAVKRTQVGQIWGYPQCWKLDVNLGKGKTDRN